MSEYRLTYSTTEDRLLLSIGNEQQAIALTRRLTRGLLKALAKTVAQQKANTSVNNEAVRNTILNFEHSKAVTEAFADGTVRREKSKPTKAAAPKLATAVDIIGKKKGGATLVFKGDGEPASLALDSRGIYLLISTILEIMVNAEWDFPQIASWLEPVSPRAQEPQPTKVIH